MGSWLPWRKLASNPPGLDWPALPWQSRGLYALLLGLANDAGRIPLGRLGLPSLAGGINAPWCEVQPHFDALVSAGWLEVDGLDVALPHFADSQRAATTAERVAEFRKRVRNEPVTTEKRPSNEKLPDCNESVTKRELDKKEIRIDQNRSESLVDSDPSQPELALVPQLSAESKQPKAQVIAQIAVTLFGELQAARKRCNPNVRCEVRKVLPGHTREIERCLREGLTVDQLRHVISVWELLVKTGKREGEHFGPVSPFRAGNVMQYVEMSLDDARKPRNQAPHAARLPEPTRAVGNPPGGLDLEAARAKAADKVDPVVQAQLDKLLGRT